MRNDYTDYIQHGFGHKYVAKVKTASGNKYFYTQDEYNAYLRGGSPKRAQMASTPSTSTASGAKISLKTKLNNAINGRAAGIHQTPTRGLSGAAYTVKKKASSVKSSINSAKNEALYGRQAGIHQTPTRGLYGAAYTAKNKASATGSAIKKTAKGAAASIGSKQIKNANGPSAPVSTMAGHKANQAKLRGQNVLAKVNSAKNKVLGEPDSNSAYRVTMRKAKNAVANVGKAIDRTFGHGEKNNRMNVPEKALMNIQNKLSSLEYKVGSKIKSLLKKNKKVSPELASKMADSVSNVRQEVVSSGADAETIKMMNDKLDKILKQIEANQPIKNTGSHPSYNQGTVSYKDYKPSQGSRPTNNQGYVPKKVDTGNLAVNYRKNVNATRAKKKASQASDAQKDFNKQMNKALSYAKKKKKK